MKFLFPTQFHVAFNRHYPYDIEINEAGVELKDASVGFNRHYIPDIEFNITCVELNVVGIG